jgi:hypothetical protein
MDVRRDSLVLAKRKNPGRTIKRVFLSGAELSLTGELRLWARSRAWQATSRCSFRAKRRRRLAPGAAARTGMAHRQGSFDVASHVHVTRISAQVDGDTLTWRSEVVADGVRAAGVDRIVTLGTTQVRASTIVKHQFRFDMSDPQTAMYAAFVGAGQPKPVPDAPSPVR